MHHFSSPTLLKGSRGQVRPETGQKPNTNLYYRPTLRLPTAILPLRVPVAVLQRPATRVAAAPGTPGTHGSRAHLGVVVHPHVDSAVHWQFGILISQVFGRFSAKLGPKTPLERRGSSCSAGCSKNQPPRPILRPFRGNSEFGNHPLQ